MEIIEATVNEKKEKQLVFMKPDVIEMNYQESLIKAKYNYIDLCNTITNEFNFEKLMSLKTVEEVKEQYKRMRFNLIEKLQLVNTTDTEKFITDMLNVQEFVEE